MMVEQKRFERQIAPQKVALFERQFGGNYRLLAYHAALPLVLTPELVHYLRTEFLLDLVPWESEADLLLSDLCSQVGYELYAMDTAVRSYLLEQMQGDDRIPQDRMQSVAQVLMSYVMYLSHLNPGQRERELQVQRWAAMAYLGDEQCRQMADEIAQQFEASGGQGDSTAVKAEFARLARITQELEPQLQAHPELVEFARRVGQVFRSPETLTAEERQRAFVVGDRLLQLPGEGWNFPPLQPLSFTIARLLESSDSPMPFLQTEQFTVATLTLEPPTDYLATDDLSTEKSINYTKLQNLLETGKWREADEETWNVMLQVTGQEEKGYLHSGDISQIPDTDLRTINQLWVKYSNGKFGFSTQKRIWYEVNQDWQRFTHLVGWRGSRTGLIDYTALTFNLNAPIGHLPFQYGTSDNCWVWGRDGLGSRMDYLLSRQDI